MSPEKTPLQQNSPEKMSPDAEDRQKAVEFLKDKSEFISEINQMIAIFKEHELDKLPLEELEEMKSDVEAALKEEKVNEKAEDEAIERPAEEKVDEGEKSVETTEVKAEESPDEVEKEDVASDEKAEQSDEIKKEKDAESAEKKEQKLLAEKSEPKSPISAWENEPEQMDKFKHFTREDVAELIKSGATTEEIWEQAKDAGVFFKFDGSSYYLSQSSKGEKRKWRRRSGNNNTSDGHYEDKMFKYIESSIEDYEKLQDAYPSLEDAFTASNMLQAYGEKPTMNKVMSMSKYWDDISKTIDGYKSEEKSESLSAEDEPDVTVKPGDIVRYLDEEGSKVEAAVRVTNAKQEDGKTLISFDGGKSYHPFAEMEEESNLNKVEVASGEQGTEEEESDEQDLITEDVFNNFVKNKEVPDEVIEQIAQKMANNSSDYTTQEMDIYNELGTEIEQRTKEIKQSTEAGATKENSDEGQEEKPKTPESVEELSEGDMVYYMEMEMRRWRDPKKIDAIVEVSGIKDERFAKFKGEDSLFPLSKLELATDTDTDETEFRPTTERESGVYLEGEDLDDVPDADELVDEIDETANEASKPKNETSKESQSEEVDSEIKEKFQDQFSISEEDLLSIPGFTSLSAGQQKLVYKNFSKVTLGRIEEQGLMDYREDMSESGRFSRMWKGFFGAYYKKKEQSMAGDDILNKGIDLHRGALSDIVKQTRISGLDLHQSGSLKFISNQEFAEIADENIPEEVELLSRLNTAAAEFSQVSDEWRYADTFSKAKDSIKKLFGGEVDDYRKKQKAYKDALSECVDHFSDKHGQEGVIRLMEIDKKVRFTQFFESGNNTDYEEALQNIKDEPKWWRIVDNVGAEKGAYMAMGFAGRTASYGMLSIAAVPVAIASAFGIGGVRARKHALEELSEEAKLRRGGNDASLNRSTEKFLNKEVSEELGSADSLSGIKNTLQKRKQEQNKADVINAVSSESLNNKLQQQLKKINSPFTSEKERNAALEALRRRIRYTRIKMEGGEYQEGSEDGEKDGKTHEFSGGLVDYGEAYQRTGRRYDLLSTLGEAEAALAVADPDIRGDIDARLDRYLNYKNDKVKSYVHKKTARGAVLAGGFAALGSWLGGHWSSDEAGQVDAGATEIDLENTNDTGTNEWPGPVSPEEGSAENLTDPPVFPEEDATGGDATGVEEIQEAESAGAEEAEMQPITSEANAEALGVQEIVIDDKGEGMIHAIADTLEDKFEIQRDQAMRIGNELYLKGEDLEGTDAEMYNLVGKGASFSLDFGELTAEELQEGSAQDLVENIEFSQKTFDAGPSGIEGLDIPEQEAAEQASATAGAEDASQQTNSIETRDFDTSSYDLSSLGDLETRTVGMDLDRFREVLDANNLIEDIHDRLDEGINSSRMSTSSTYEGIRVSALSDLRDYLYANSEQNIVDIVEGMREENPRLLMTLDKVIELEDPEYGGPMHQLERYISTGYLDMYASSEEVSIPRPGPETAPDIPSESTGGAEDAAEAASDTPADTANTRPENPIQTKEVEGMTIEQANERAEAAEKAAWQERANADKNINVTTVGEAQNPSAEPGSGIEQLSDDLREAGVNVDPQEAPSDVSGLDANIESLAVKANETSIDDLRTLAAELEAQSVVESGYIDVPTERLDALEAFLADNVSSRPSEIIQKMADDNPELLTVFERVMNSGDISDIADSESFQSLHTLTQHYVSELTAEDFPDGMPKYARTSIDVSILRLQE